MMSKISGGVTKWCVSIVIAYAIVGYPIIAGVSELFGVDNRWLSSNIRLLILGLSFLILFFNFSDRFGKRNGRFWFCWWGFWLVYIVIMSMDIINYIAIPKYSPFEYFGYAVGVCLIPSMVAVYMDKFDSVFLIPLLILFFGVIGISLNLYYLFGLFALSADLLRARLETDVLNPIALGHLGVTVVLMCLWFLARPLSYLKRLLVIVLSLSGFFVMIIAASRGPFLSLVFCVLLYIYSFGKIVFVRWILIFSVLFLVFILMEPDFYNSTLLLARVGDQMFEDESRTYLLKESISLIYQNFFFGAGVEPLYSYPHNLIVESFLVGGITSGVFFTLMMCFGLARIFAVMRFHDYSWVALLFIQFFVMAMVSGNLWSSWQLYMSLCAIISVPVKKQYTFY